MAVLLSSNPFGTLDIPPSRSNNDLLKDVGFFKFIKKYDDYYKDFKGLNIQIGNSQVKDKMLSSFRIMFNNIYLFKTFNVENGYHFKKVNIKKEVTDTFGTKSWNDILALLNIGLVKVKSYEKSAGLFLYTNHKKKMNELSIEGQLFQPTNVLMNFQCKKDGSIRDVIEVEYLGKNLKFLLEDLEWVFPPIDDVFKGYNKPKDKVVKVGRTIRVMDNRETRLPFKHECVLDNITTVGNKKYAEIKFNGKLERILISVH